MLCGGSGRRLGKAFYEMEGNEGNMTKATIVLRLRLISPLNLADVNTSQRGSCFNAKIFLCKLTKPSDQNVHFGSCPRAANAHSSRSSA